MSTWEERAKIREKANEEYFKKQKRSEDIWGLIAALVLCFGILILSEDIWGLIAALVLCFGILILWFLAMYRH